MGLGNFSSGGSDDDETQEDAEEIQARLVPVVNVTAHASALRDVPKEGALDEAQRQALDEAENLEEYLKDSLGFIPGVHLEFEIDKEATEERTTLEEEE